MDFAYPGTKRSGYHYAGHLLVGGFSEIKKSQRSLPPHNCGGPVQPFAYSHFVASTENVMIVETLRAFYNSYYEALVTEQPLIKMAGCL